jgi:hypothetical protein
MTLNYLIVSAISSTVLEETVNKNIQQGWVPIGGPLYVPEIIKGDIPRPHGPGGWGGSGHGSWSSEKYIQAMVKYK